MVTFYSLLIAEIAPQEFIIMQCREGAGMFSIFNDVLALIKYYDKGYYRGIEVDFDEQGIYYDRKYGKNWWSYYCEPICFGEKTYVREVVGDAPFTLPWETEKHTSREEAYTLIQKYIRLKPDIQKVISSFEKQNFKNYFVIAVHYRGTDKVTEAPFVPYEDVRDAILKVKKQYGKLNYKIFLATDEQPFLEYMISFFGDELCYQSDALRSKEGDPIHLSDKYSPYKKGKSAITDCVLLSKGQFLIRTSSNLSLWSTFFNPFVPVLELNKRY